MQEMRLKHSEDMAAAGRRRTASIASLARQADLDRQEWERRAKEEAVSEGEKVLLRSFRVKILSPHTVGRHQS